MVIELQGEQLPIVFLGLLLYTTDRVTKRATVVPPLHGAIVVDAQGVRVVPVKRGRPIEADFTDIVETATFVETRSRVPNSLI